MWINWTAVPETDINKDFLHTIHGLTGEIIGDERTRNVKTQDGTIGQLFGFQVSLEDWKDTISISGTHLRRFDEGEQTPNAVTAWHKSDVWCPKGVKV